MIIAVDFDGTIVEHKYPSIGKEIPFATSTLKKLASEHHHIILWTVRRGELLDEAVKWCNERGLYFFAINKNYPEEIIGSSEQYGKINADIFIDDRNLGGIPDWGSIYAMIKEGRSWQDIYSDTAHNSEKKRKWLW